MVASSRKLNIWFHLQGNAPIPGLRYVAKTVGSIDQKPTIMFSKKTLPARMYTVIYGYLSTSRDLRSKNGPVTGPGPENFEIFRTDSDQGQVPLRKPGLSQTENKKNPRLSWTDRYQNLSGSWISGVKRRFQTLKQGSRHSNDLYVL